VLFDAIAEMMLAEAMSAAPCRDAAFATPIASASF